MRLGLIALSFAVISAAAPAQVSALAAARQAGLVGERYDGYMDYVRPPSTAIRRQVEAVNIRRRALYSGLAARRQVSPAEVGITAGCQTLASTQVGWAYMLPDRVWRRRAAGQGAPLPDYCR